jgi:general secretion pathway protein D
MAMQIRRASILGVMVVAVSLSVFGGASAQQPAGQQGPGGQAPPRQAAPQPSTEPNAVPSTTAAPAAAATQTAPTNGNGTGDIKIVMNFQDAPLDAVLKYLSEKAGLTVIASGVSLDGRITVISIKPITVDEAVALVNSVLKDKDLAAVRVGKTIEITTVARAKQRNLPVVHVTKDSDVPEDKDDIMTFVIPVRYVDAQALSQNLMSLLPEYATLEANRDGNALIITDSASNVRRVMKIIQALDTHMATVAEIKVWRLTNALASTTAQLINSIFQQEAQAARGGNRGGGGGMTFGGRGGRGGGGGMGGAMDMIANAMGGGGNAPSAATRGNQAVVAAADDRTNSVVVRGPAEVLAIIDGMIEQLNTKTTEIADVRVKQLRYADALNTAQVINQLFGQSTGSSSSRGGMQGMGPGGFQMQGGRGGRGGMGGGQSTSASSSLMVTAAADSRTNSVVITGPAAILDVVLNVIDSLDQQIPNVADVKTFHLQYADAANTATLINDVFGANRSTRSSTSSRSTQNQQIQFGGRGGGMGGQGGATQGTSSSAGVSDVTVVASADTRTNSVVVSGAPETLKIIADVIKELDQNPEQERRIFVYPLKNATASNLMTIMNNLFTQMRTLNQQGTRTTQSNQGGAGGGRGGAAAGGGGTTAAASSTSESAGNNDLSDETYFQADTTTNSLLILTSTKNYLLVKPIIDDLDKSVGQVLIKVLFAEITHTDTVDLGVDFAGLNLRGVNSGFSTPAVGTTPANNVLNGTQGSTTFGSPSLGLTLNTVESDWDVTLRTLQTQTRVNVLSRPYVLAKNNQAATISVAAEVPIPSGTSSNANGATTTISYRTDIGIVLTVTPQVNPDGVVNMTVNPKITNRTGRVQVSESLSAETFSTRSATTIVTVKDGQTVVIGGLIEDKINDTINKIPLLGDIPIIGALFGRTVHEKDKTELLIFMSPRVAQEPAKLTDISVTEREGTNMAVDPTVSDLFRAHMANMENGAEPNQPKITVQKESKQ